MNTHVATSERNDRRLMQTEWRAESVELAVRFKAHAEQRGLSTSHFATAWVLHNRLVDGVIAGPRTLAQWTDYLGAIGHKLTAEDEARYVQALVELPLLMETALKEEERIAPIARQLSSASDMLYLGRGVNYPVALEGALKLKEISYIHAEGYAAGEMKHGPIALIDETLPVVVLVPKGPHYEKVVSNIQEVRARGAQVIAIATDGNEDIQHHADDVIYVPRTPAFLQAVLAVLPLQLLAYRIARLRGLNVDQPRNLAKTVTVE